MSVARAAGGVGAAGLPLSPHSELPPWPLLALFWAFPIAWLVGVGAFFAILMAPVLLAYLLIHDDVRVPRAIFPWLTFVLFVAASGVMVDSGGRAIGFLFRFGNYVAATLVLIYITNASQRRLSDERLTTALTAMWFWVVLGGFLGVLFPFGSIRTPLSYLLPGGLMANELVQDWVIPKFSELQQPWGSPEVFARPSAPFPYTNGWGSSYSLLMPFVVATAHRLHGWRRASLVLVLLASLIPAAATLNRGMVIALGAGLLYVLLRLAVRGHIGPLLGAMGVLAAIGVGLFASGVLERVALRTTYSTTTVGRATIYRETFERTLQSPILGWGGPRPSRALAISVGTQGHVWNVMFSHGLLALSFFVIALVWFAWSTRSVTGPAYAAHVTLVIAVVAITFYGFDGPQMIVTLTAAAIGLRAVARATRPSNPPSIRSLDSMPT